MKISELAEKKNGLKKKNGLTFMSLAQFVGEELIAESVAEDTKIAYLGYEILNATTKLCTYIDKTPHLWKELIDGMDSGKHMDYLMKKLGIGFNELRKFEEVFEVTPGVEWDFYEWPLAWKEGEWDATVIQPWKNYAQKVLKARGAINPPKKLMNSEMSEGEGDAAVGYGPYDRGVADGYYGRQPKPHKYVTNAEGKRIPVKLTDPAEVAEYMAGYKDDSFGSKAYESVNEAPGDFGLGANTRVAKDDEMQAYLDRIKNKEKEKTDQYKMPYVHGSNIKIKDESGKDYDLAALKAAIVQRPTQILKQNEKMQHSDGTKSIFYNVGLPALKGLAVNEQTGEFVIVDTCPGAGACKTFCYAMKGSYVMFKAVSMNQTRLLNFLLNDPEGFADEMSSEIRSAIRKNAGTKVIVRWHDAGDFFSPEYLALAYSVARKFPDVEFYAYTKIADVASGEKPANFKMNFSAGAKSDQEKKIDFQKVKHSRVVPNALFWDLIVKKGSKPEKNAQGKMQFIGPKELDTFKSRLAQEFNIDKNSILTYDEMMAKPKGTEPKWNVIVVPGDGDDSANRADVKGSYLLFH